MTRAGMNDLRHWRAMCRGHGRDILAPVNDMTLHSDASDLGYGGTLGLDQSAGAAGRQDGNGLWEAQDRADGITIRELRAVRLLLARHFAETLKDPLTKQVLLWEDNQVFQHQGGVAPAKN